MQKKNSILFILHLPPPVHGAAIVSKQIQDSNLINNFFDTKFINLATSSGLKEIGKPGWKKISKFFYIQFTLLNALFFKKYDLCYVTLTSSGPGFLKDFLIVLILKLFNKKIVYHFHNKGVSEFSKNFFLHLLYKFVFNKTKTILLSPRLYPDFKKYITLNNTFFCANGIPSKITFVDQKNIIHKFDKKCKLLFLSNMMIEKGVVELLNACQLLKLKGYQFECHFVGSWSGISFKEFKNLVNNKMLTEVVFAHGPKYGYEKDDYFLNSDIFVFPSYYKNESFPLVLLEAMNYGLPIVATSEGGIADIVLNNETGFIVEQRNTEDLFSKLELLIQNPYLREKFGILGYKRYLEYFTVEKFENNILNILKEVVADNN